MNKPLISTTIEAPGFFGINWQDSPTNLPTGFGSSAINCIIDEYGRLGSRKGWTPLNSTSATLGTSNINCIAELITNDGTSYKIVCGNNKIFKLSTGALVELTYGGGGVAPNISASHWQAASLNGKLYLFQIGHNPLVFDPTTSTTTYRRISEVAGYVGTVPDANVCIAAHGRLWVANTVGDKTTIAWSDLLAGHIWTTGTSGSLNVSKVWVAGADEITALAAHNGFLIIFGRKQILTYQGMDDPTATSPVVFKVADTIGSIGCMARDTVQSTGTDLLFLSGTGIRSLARTIQDKSMPLNDISKNIRDHLVRDVLSESETNLKAIYSDVNACYLLSLPTTGETYCFDTRLPLQDGSYRVTTWTITPTALCVFRDKTLAMGFAGYLGSYGDYIDNDKTYRMEYYTNHMALGDPNTESIIKKINLITIGGNGQVIVMGYAFDFNTNYQKNQLTLTKFKVAEYGVSEYGIGEYSAGIVLGSTQVNMGGTGKTFQFGLEADINGAKLSYQRMDIFSKDGKLT